MPFTRATHRFAAWLAMLAMVLGALAPTVAQAVVAAKGGPDWMQVCSASGMVWVQADALEHERDAAAGDTGKAVADAARHCPLFNLHGAAGLPPAPLLHAALAPHTAPPTTPVRSAIAVVHWPAAQSRAPPTA